jgi:hypothetical protein
MSDEPDAGTTPAASQRRRVSHGTVVRSRASCNRTAAETKIRARRIPARPPAGPRSERVDLFSSGKTWIGENGGLGTRCDGLFRHWRLEEGSRGPGFDAAVDPGGDSDGGLLDLVNRHRSHGQQAEHNADAAWGAAIARLPTSDAPRADAEQFGDTVLRDAERVECRVEFGLLA